ncbi:putative GNAT family acetyltransferase [Hydrogenophaga palleronii]|uniref:GNAT family acetyltransferase n=1 Tax=Hydrogenophaga palleronii TaxID=65655 RepID=A0ABU1WN40_9BURK|nr:GNAT family N-acetyltransferase [Hydrogenophaga palleronii]MDR7150457.1 putative GNAT family acetyltransferase [Hydrogenophaga palleronii]
MKSLDRPVWASLTHAPHLAVGDEFAKRYRRDVNLFASACDDSINSLAALRDLVPEGESVFVLQVPAICVPEGLVVARVAQGVQMLAARPIAREDGDSVVVELGEADAPEMLALAQLTEPGPFLARTHTMGRFIGARINGRLAAMAGERMRFPGFTEVSGVCTHPDFRGRGLARLLSSVIANAIQQRGEQPFLHAWTSNRPAIALYEHLGFEFRTVVQVAVLARPD